MKSEIRDRGDIRVIEISGKVTIGTGDVKIRELIDAALDAGQNKILLDLHGVTAIDSSGIGEMVACFTSVKKRGGQLKLLRLSKKMDDLLQVTQLITVFEVFDDRIPDHLTDVRRFERWPASAEAGAPIPERHQATTRSPRKTPSSRRSGDPTRAAVAASMTASGASPSREIRVSRPSRTATSTGYSPAATCCVAASRPSTRTSPTRSVTAGSSVAAAARCCTSRRADPPARRPSRFVAGPAEPSTATPARGGGEVAAAPDSGRASGNGPWTSSGGGGCTDDSSARAARRRSATDTDPSSSSAAGSGWSLKYPSGVGTGGGSGAPGADGPGGPSTSST